MSKLWKKPTQSQQNNKPPTQHWWTMTAKGPGAHLYHQILLRSLRECSRHCKFGISEISRQHQTQNVTSTPEEASPAQCLGAICCSWYPGGFCFSTKLPSPANPAGAPGKTPWLPVGFWLEGKGWKGWDGKDKHHPEVFCNFFFPSQPPVQVIYFLL